MKPLDQLSQEEARSLAGLFIDLDDTLLSEGRLSKEAYCALFDLRESGMDLFLLTGRPASWGELLTRMWPVKAAIVENGALAFTPGATGPKLIDTVPAQQRRDRTTRLKALVERARCEIPDLLPANDVHGRISDFTFDIGETQAVAEAIVSQAIALAHSHGARTTRSSVHLHFTYDRVDKASGAIAYLARFGVDATRARSLYGFVGDSENDASCFAGFSTTFGVANLRGHFSLLPRYITQNPSGSGFSELAASLTSKRKS